MFLDGRLANTPRWFITPPRDAYVRIPEVILDTVAFIGLSNKATGLLDYRATGFFISLEDDEAPGISHRYFITAGHVARRIENEDYVVRLNLKSGATRLVESGAEFRWYFHPDPAVDLAAGVWHPQADSALNHYPIRSEMLINDEDVHGQPYAKYGVGDEVFIVGLFSRFQDTSRNWPIVRMGNIAMLPTEKVDTELGMADIYMIEARSIGGLSGSSVFFRETVYAPFDGTTIQRAPLAGMGAISLLGMVHGHHDVGLSKKAREQAEARINMGIALATPAPKIRELIVDHPELIAMRKIDSDAIQARDLPTMDIAPEDKPTSQKTRAGATIPVLTRGEFFKNLERATGRRKKKD